MPDPIARTDSPGSLGGVWFAFHLLRLDRKFTVSQLRDLCLEVYYVKSMPSIIFTRTSPRMVDYIWHNEKLTAYPFLRLGTNEPVDVDEDEMDTFKFVTGGAISGPEIYEGDITKGDHVRVTEGILKGREGYVLRIKGNKRFVIQIKDVVNIVTTYIPARFLQRIDPAPSPAPAPSASAGASAGSSASPSAAPPAGDAAAGASIAPSGVSVNAATPQ